MQARRRRLEEGDGSDRWGPPVGVPGREGGAAWAAHKEEGARGGVDWADGTRRGKGEKEFPWDLKYCKLDFKWLKLFREL